MAPTIRTENALKRSEELLAVSQEGSALQTLHDAIVNKKHRAYSEDLENAMMKHVSLCVSMRKGRLAKEALHQYKNVCQNSKPQSIDKVVKHFLELSEGQVNTAKEKAEKILEGIEDLDAIETPERIIMSAVTGEDTKDRTDREVVTPWLKFLWESYRTALDVLRNNANLILCYQYTATQAFYFCKKYARKTEFRRLSEILRNHLINMAKLTSQYSVSLNDPESLQLLISIRFVQLQVAMSLELWQEAFKSIEDVHRLMIRSKNKLKQQQLIEYYQQLAQIFFVSGNFLFHAYSLKIHFMMVRNTVSAEEKNKYASRVLIAALSIPDTTSLQSSTFVDIETQQAKLTRLASIVGLSKIPTREMLLKEIMAQEIMDNVVPEAKHLYRTLEQEFSPLSICEKVAPILGFLEKDDILTHYIQPLKTVSLTRLLQQLGQIFKTIKLESVFQLAIFSTPHEVEKFMMESCRKGDLHVRINHLNGSVTFNTKSLGDLGTNSQLGGVHLQTNDVTSQFTRIRSRLEHALVLTDPESEQKKKKERTAAIQDIASHLEEEYNQTKEKRDIIQKTKQRMDEISDSKEKELKQKKFEQQQKELAAEKHRLQEEAKRREKERIDKEKLEIDRKNKLKIAETLSKKTDIKIDTSKIDNMTPEEIISMQAQQIEQAKRELQEKLSKLAKKMDHTERAFRKEEIPLLQNDYIKQQTLDKENAEKKYQQDTEASQEKHKRDLEMKQKVLIFAKDAQALKDVILSKRQKELGTKAQELEALKQKEKKERRELHERKMERAKQEWIEAQEKKKKQKEEEEKKQKEEEERLRKQRDLEEKRKVAASDLESKMKQTITDPKASQSTTAAPTTTSSSGRYVPPSRRTGQDSEPSSSTPVAASPSSSSQPPSSTGGRYVPPSRRTQEPATEVAPPKEDRFGALRDERDRDSGSGRSYRDERPPVRDDRDRSYGSGGGGGGDRFRSERPSYRDERDRPSYRDERDSGSGRSYRDERPPVRDDRDRVPPRDERDRVPPRDERAPPAEDKKYRPPGARDTPTEGSSGVDGWQVVNKGRK